MVDYVHRALGGDVMLGGGLVVHGGGEKEKVE